MNKKLIRLTESDLHRIVKESVNRVLREGGGDNAYLQENIQQAIFSLSAVASVLQKESESHVYGGDSEMIPNGNSHFEYNKVYELCLKTIKALQSIQQ